MSTLGEGSEARRPRGNSLDTLYEREREREVMSLYLSGERASERLDAFQALLTRIPLALYVIINYNERSSPARRGDGPSIRGESSDRARPRCEREHVKQIDVERRFTRTMQFPGYVTGRDKSGGERRGRRVSLTKPSWKRNIFALAGA